LFRLTCCCALEILIATRDYDLRLLAFQPESEAAAAAHPDRTNVVELVVAPAPVPAAVLPALSINRFFPQLCGL